MKIRHMGVALQCALAVPTLENNTGPESPYKTRQKPDSAHPREQHQKNEARTLKIYTTQP